MPVYSRLSRVFIGIYGYPLQNQMLYAPDSEIEADYRTCLEISIARASRSNFPEAQRLEADCMNVKVYW